MKLNTNRAPDFWHLALSVAVATLAMVATFQACQIWNLTKQLDRMHDLAIVGKAMAAPPASIVVTTNSP